MADKCGDGGVEFPYGCFALGRSISILHRFSQKFIEHELRAYNLSKAQMELLIILFKAEEPLNQRGINAFFDYNKATITRLLNSLEQEGYLTRMPSGRDRREKLIILTEKGEAMQQVIIQVLIKEEKTFGEILGKSEEKPVREQLYRLAESLNGYATKITE